jgi:hypothetical protein
VKENLTLIISAVGLLEGTLALLFAAIGILAGLVLASFVCGLLVGAFIAYCACARKNS